MEQLIVVLPTSREVHLAICRGEREVDGEGDRRLSLSTDKPTQAISELLDARKHGHGDSSSLQ